MDVVESAKEGRSSLFHLDLYEVWQHLTHIQGQQLRIARVGSHARAGPSSTQGPQDPGGLYPPSLCISSPPHPFSATAPSLGPFSCSICNCHWEPAVMHVYTPALLARGPTNPTVLAGWELSESPGPRLLGTQPCPRRPRSRKDTWWHECWSSEQGWCLPDGDSGASRPGENRPAGSPHRAIQTISCSQLPIGGGPGHVDHPCWTWLESTVSSSWSSGTHMPWGRLTTEKREMTKQIQRVPRAYLVLSYSLSLLAFSLLPNSN